jgi:hypothetical protein
VTFHHAFEREDMSISICPIDAPNGRDSMQLS